MPSSTRIAAFSVLSASLFSIAGVSSLASAGEGRAPVWQHGLYDQAHWSTKERCDTFRTSALAAIKRDGSPILQAGECHPIAAVDDGEAKNGFVYDVTYSSPTPLFDGDRSLGPTPSERDGAHSFRVQGAYASQADAKAAESSRAASLGSKVSWRSGVKYNALSKQYVYEIDYTSRTPLFNGHVEISEKAGVTSPSLGVDVIVPTNPTDTAKDSGISKPGDATTGWTNPTTTTPSAPGPVDTAKVEGLDVSNHTVKNDWADWKAKKIGFIYTKATEATYYTNSKWASQYTGAADNGMVRGSYHFAVPSQSSGVDQANYFLAHGGGWSPDGKTLPGALDIEWNPYGSTCFGLSQTEMSKWVSDFMTTYRAKTGINPTIYTASAWWNQCVGSAAPTAGNSPLWQASWQKTIANPPTSWSGRTHTIWQYAAVDSLGYDRDLYNGNAASLKKFATTGSR